MKRVVIVLASLLAVSLSAGSASAAEKGIRWYRAETDDGQFLAFRTVREDTGRRLDGLFFTRGFELSCDDGTTRPMQGGFTEWPWYFEGLRVTVDEKGRTPPWALHLRGTFRPASASGTLRYSAVFINDEVTRVKLCTTGYLRWTAERV